MLDRTITNNSEKIQQVDLFGDTVAKDVLLRDRWIEPPFSVLDTKGADWQLRKRRWENLGIKSEIGRDAKAFTCNGADAIKYDYMPNIDTGTSIFDPALTELMYKWFCPDGGDILDPFAGGSVRGIVAHYLGYNYTGIELRQEQVDSNREQGLDILPINNQPSWYCGDSDKLLCQKWNKQFDFIFSCPPYADLEVYSELPDDLSNMPYSQFVQKLYSIIKQSVDLLKSQHYACFVVGEVRDKQGYYYGFVADTIKAFMSAGAKLYNEAVLLNCCGTAPIRARQFAFGQKLVKLHQNVLVFKKA